MERREQELVLLLQTSFAGTPAAVAEAGARLERECQQRDALPLLAIASEERHDYDLRVSAAIHLSKVARLDTPLPDASYLLERISAEVVRLPRSRKSLRHYFEVAIALLAAKHTEIDKTPLAALRSVSGDSPGAASLLRLMLTRVLGREEQISHLGEYLPLLFQAGGVLMNDDRGNEDRLLDWLSQVSKILEFIHSNLPCECCKILTISSCSLMLESLLELLQRKPAVSVRIRKRSYRVFSAAAAIATNRGAIVAGFVQCFEDVAGLALTDLAEIDLTQTENGKVFCIILWLLSSLLSGLVYTSHFADSLQRLISSVLLPVLSSSYSEESLCDSDPQEFISQYCSVCDSDDSDSLYSTVAVFLRAITEKYSWGLRFIVDSGVLNTKCDLALAAVSEKAVDREDLIEAIESHIRGRLRSSEDMCVAEKCHFLHLISRYISCIFHDSPSDTEQLVSFLIDSAGSLTSKAVSMQACATLSEMFMDSEAFVVLEACLQEVASGLSQLIPVIRCKGLYECVRLLIVECFDELGSEGCELVSQLVHRVKIELQRYSFKRQHNQRHNSQLLIKCFSALRAAAFRNLSPGASLHVYTEMLSAGQLLVEGRVEELVADWCAVVSKCLETVPSSHISAATLMSRLTSLLEIVSWDLTACFILVNAIIAYCGADAIPTILPDMCQLLRKTADFAASHTAMDQSLLLIQALCHCSAIAGSANASLTQLIPWAISHLEQWYAHTAIEPWHLHITNLYLSLSAYDMREVAKAAEVAGIRMENVVFSLGSQAVGPIEQFDRKSLVFGLMKVVKGIDDVRVMAAALNTIVELYKGVVAPAADIAPDETRKPGKRPVSVSDEENETIDVEGTSGELMNNAQQCYSPILQIAEKDLIRAGLEELKRDRLEVYERVIGSMGVATRRSLVSILTMESPSSTHKLPRLYLIPKYSRC